MNSLRTAGPSAWRRPRSGRWPGVGAALLASALLAWLLWPVGERPGSTPGAAGQQPRPPAADAAAAAPAALADRTVERRELPRAARTDAVTTIRGRVVAAETGAPLAGATVQLHASLDRHDGSAAATWAPPSPITTDGEGCFAFRFVPLPTITFSVECTAPQRVRRGGGVGSLRQGVTIDFGDVPMALGTEPRLLVVREDDRPCDGLEICLGRLDRPQTEPPALVENFGSVATTDEHGLAVFPLRSPGKWRYDIRTALQGPTAAEFDLPSQGEPFTLRVQLRLPPPENCVRGIVCDPAGLPVADLPLVLPWPHSIGNLPATTARDGSFLFSLPRRWDGSDRFHIELAKSAQQYELLENGGEFAWGAQDLRLVVRHRAAASLRVSVVDGDGEPLERFGASCWLHTPSLRRNMRSHTPAAPTDVHPGGVVLFDDLGPGPYRISVIPPEPWCPCAELPVEVAEGRTTELSVRVSRPAALEVTVVDRATQAPLADVALRLAKVVPEADAGKVTPDSYCSPLATVLRAASGNRGITAFELATATSDADGRARLLAAPDTPALVLFAEGRRCVALVRHDIALPPEGAKLRLEVAAAAQLHGTVAPALFVQRFGPTAAQLAATNKPLAPPDPQQLTRYYPQLQLRPKGRRERTASQHLTADGGFALGALAAGTYDVWLDTRSGDLGPLATITLQDGEDRELPLDVSPFLPGRVTGHFFVDGSPWQGEVCLLAEGMSDRFTTDATGTATSDWLLPGSYLPYVIVPRGDDERRIFAREPLQLRSGAEVELTVDVHRRQVVVTVIDTDGKPVVGRRVVVEAIDEPKQGEQWKWGVLTDAQGKAAFDPAPAGRLRIRSLAPGQEPHDLERQPAGLVLGELQPGDDKATLRLPR